MKAKILVFLMLFILGNCSMVVRGQTWTYNEGNRTTQIRMTNWNLEGYSNLSNEEIIKLVSKEIKENLSNYRKYAVRAVAYGIMGNLDKAIVDMKKCVSMIPESHKDDLIVYHKFLEMAYCAIDDFEKTYKEAMITERIERGFHDKGELDTMKILAYPTQLDHFLLRAEICESHFNYDAAIKHSSEAISFAPNAGEAYEKRAHIQNEIGNYNAAVDDYTSAIRIDLDNVNYYNSRAIVYKKLEQYADAIMDFTKIIEIKPNDADAYFNRGLVYGNLRQGDKEIGDYTKAIELDSNYTAAYNNRGAVFGNRGEFATAMKDFHKAYELDPDDMDNLLNLCICYDRTEEYLNAIDCFKKMLALDTDNASALDNLGYAYLATNDYSSAITNFNKCLELKFDEFDAILGLALANYYQNDLATATKYINQARELKPILKEGSTGFDKFKEEGWFYNEKDDAALKKMFVELK